MKTAMQELITHLEMLKSRVDLADIDSIIEYATNALEKEKEQIIAAMNYSTYREMKGINISNEEYYNQTYNKPLENK